MSQSAWGLILLFGAAATVPVVMLTLSWIAGKPKGRSLTDMTPYECGKKPFASARQRFSVKFYLIAMLFIIFDIEAAFLYPWAVQLKQQSERVSSGFILVEMLIFIAILAAGFGYAWGRGALDWDR